MRISTGIAGLDHILHGGLLPGRTYLVAGEPGTGKTTLGLHFLSCDHDSSLLISFCQKVEREPLSRQISTAIEEKKPKRIFIDSFGSFRSLATDAFQHRRLAQSFFRFATMRGGTLLIASEEKDCARDVDGVILLASGPEGRSVRVTKLRGSDFHAETYAMRLSSEGLDISLSAA